MEFVASSYPLTSPLLVSLGNFIERVKQISSLAVSAIIGNSFSAILTFCFALVGGLKFIIGSTLGSINGAVFSSEAVESSLAPWQFDESGIRCLIDVIASFLSGRFVRERISRAMLSAVQSQMGTVETSFYEFQNIFDTGGVKGLSGDSVEKLPKITIATDNNFDVSGERVSCSICLQDLELGQTVRSLPHCNHMFHMPCIDEWLLRHGSCPLCRRDL